MDSKFSFLPQGTQQLESSGKIQITSELHKSKGGRRGD